MNQEYGPLGNFMGPNHALHTGMAFGTLIKAGLEVDPEYDDDGDYTAIIVVTDEENVYRLKVLPVGDPE